MIDGYNISPELEFILSCLKGNNIDPSSFQNLNEEKVLSLISDHRIIGPIHRALTDTVHLELKDQISELNQQNKINQLRLIHELDQLSHWFEEIPFTVLKGPVLSQQLYNDPAERTSRDLDILIDSQDLDRAIGILVDVGYELLTEYHTPKQKKAILKHFHHVELYSRSKRIVVELHWNLTTFREIRINLENIQSRLVDISIGDQKYKSLNSKDLIGYLIIHGVFHTYFRLQWLYDLKVLLESFNEQEMKQHVNYLQKEGLYDFYLITLFLLNLLFDYPMSPTEKEAFKAIPKSDKLVELCVEQIILNNSFEQRPKQRGGYLNMIRNHKVQYYAGGIKGLVKNIFARNVRPENWKIYAFPDKVFGLNHLFSRFISLIGRLKKK